MRTRRSGTIEILITVAVAVLFFNLGLTALIALVPLHVLRQKRGEAYFLSAAVLVVLVAVIVRLVAGAAVEFGGAFVVSDALVAAGLVTGLWAVDTPVLHRFARPWRFAAAGTAVAAGIVPAAVIVGSNEAFRELLDAQLVLVERMLFLGSDEGGRLLQVDAVVQVAGDVLFSTVGAFGLLLVFADYSLGNVVARFSRVQGNVVVAGRSHRFATFYVPINAVWGLIVALAGVLLGIFADIGVLLYVFRNAALILALLYAGQGIGIIATYFDARRLSVGARIGAVIGGVIGLLIPGVNIAIGLGLPGLGVAETWVPIRERVKEKYNEGHP